MAGAEGGATVTPVMSPRLVKARAGAGRGRGGVCFMPRWPAAATAGDQGPCPACARQALGAALSGLESSLQSHLSGECYQGLLPGLLASPTVPSDPARETDRASFLKADLLVLTLPGSLRVCRGNTQSPLCNLPHTSRMGGKVGRLVGSVPEAEIWLSCSAQSDIKKKCCGLPMYQIVIRSTINR